MNANEQAEMRAAHVAACTGLVQGIYYVAIGLWPLLGLASYVSATGPKPDLWSLHASAILLVAVGLAVALSSVRRKANAELRLLALAVPLGLLVIDVVHVVYGRVEPVYLVDALAQLLFAAAWSWPWLMSWRRAAPERPATRTISTAAPEAGQPAPQH